MEHEQDKSNEAQTGQLRQSDVGRRVWVHFQGWAGRTAIEAELVGETAKRYKVMVPRGLPGRCKAGGTCLVPKYAVTFY